MESRVHYAIGNRMNSWAFLTKVTIDDSNPGLKWSAPIKYSDDCRFSHNNVAQEIMIQHEWPV
jgi:hypothetical protein